MKYTKKCELCKKDIVVWNFDVGRKFCSPKCAKIDRYRYTDETVEEYFLRRKAFLEKKRALTLSRERSKIA